MPSPFPGMDPYLEGSEWTSVHAELAAEIAKQLVPKVAPKYTVRPVRRFVMDMPEEIVITATRRSTYPDVGVYKAQEPTTTYQTGAGAVAAAPSPLQLATVMPEKVPVHSIEIRDTADRELITAIEILSPTNKRGRGYEEYLGRRRRLLNSFTHLLEIDLLRKGRRVPMREPLPDAPYFVFLSRAPKRPITEVWPVQLDMRLPTVPVPLLPQDDDTDLDLQLALNTAYDAYRYELSVDYMRPPEIPLKGKTAVWAAELLQAAGFAAEKELSNRVKDK